MHFDVCGVVACSLTLIVTRAAGSRLKTRKGMSRVVIVVRVVAGVLLLAHGLVHLLYLAPDVPEFSIGRSWLLPEPARRPVALMLMAATMAGFALVALAVWGVPGLSAAWSALTIVACMLSMALLAVFWDTVLVIGIVIDVALVVIAVTRPEWADRLVG